MTSANEEHENWMGLQWITGKAVYSSESESEASIDWAAAAAVPAAVPAAVAVAAAVEKETPSSRASLLSRRSSSSPALKSMATGSHLTGCAAAAGARCGGERGTSACVSGALRFLARPATHLERERAQQHVGDAVGAEDGVGGARHGLDARLELPRGLEHAVHEALRASARALHS